MGFLFVLFTAFLIPPPSCSLCFGASVFFLAMTPTEIFSQIWLQQAKYENRTS